MNKDTAYLAVQYNFYIILRQFAFSLQNNFITLNGNNFASVLINKVLNPAFQYTGSQF